MLKVILNGARAGAKVTFQEFTAPPLEPEPLAECLKAPELEAEPMLF